MQIYSEYGKVYDESEEFNYPHCNDYYHSRVNIVYDSRESKVKKFYDKKYEELKK